MTTRAERLRRRLSDVTASDDGVTGSRTLDSLEWISRWITLAAYLAAVIIFVAAPVYALSWSYKPFPGFMIEPTRVINGWDGDGWTGHDAGAVYPGRVIRFGGLPVSSMADYDRILSLRAIGQEVSVFTEQPNGTVRMFPSVKLIEFPRRDLLRMFWLPYLVGLAYLIIGLWIYTLRGRTRPGRALAFFCVTTAIACGLLFDLSTTHAGSVIWTLAVSQLGGALISLALRFPEEWRPVHRHPWLLGVPYAVSIGLAVWGVVTLRLESRPWAYIDAWGASYRFAALGTIVFLVTMVYQARAHAESSVRRQARIVLFGSSLAFAPIVTWFLAPLAKLQVAFSPPLLLLPLLIFPLGIGLAIMRYRLWAVDRLVNRTLVYVTLTALLAGMYTASIGLSQRLFVALTGEKSDAAIVMTTLFVASAFTPAKNWLQAFVDRQFKDEQTENQALSALHKEIHAFVQFTDARQLARRLLEEAARDLGAASGAISLLQNGQPRLMATVGEWRSDARLSLPLECDGRRIGLMQLGPRQDGRPYVHRDMKAIKPVAAEVARAISWAQLVAGLPAPRQPPAA